jgi:uncharacterized membrane protein HdeD (DUF308 family)
MDDVAGLVLMALGLDLLANSTSTTVFFVSLAIGIDLIFDGAAMMGFTGAIHSLPKVHHKAI